MIEIQNYAPFIQLAVAFDFACVKFGEQRGKIQLQISGLATFGKNIIDKHNSKINPYIDSIETEILHPYLSKSRNSLKAVLIKIGKTLESFKAMNAHYLGPVSLLSGIYCMIALLLIGEIDKSTFLHNLYSYITELTFVAILIFVGLEFYANYRSIRRGSFTLYPHIYLLTIIFLFFSSVLSLYLAFKGNNIGTFPYSFTTLSRLSLFIPFISFMGVLFWLLSFGLLVLFFVFYSHIVRGIYRLGVILFRIVQWLNFIYERLFATPRYKNIKIVTSSTPLFQTFLEANKKPILYEDTTRGSEYVAPNDKTQSKDKNSSSNRKKKSRKKKHHK